MIYLPTIPEVGGAALAAYIAADAARLPVYRNIVTRLDLAGKVGTTARYYIVRNQHRRAIFRGALIALRQRLPAWARETPQARRANRAFIAAHREDYLQFRHRQREAPPAYTPALPDPISAS